MTEEDKVEVGVHERTDSHGYVVRITACIEGRTRTARWPVDDRTEAEALAESVANFVSGGGDVNALLPDEEGEQE